MEVPVSIVGKAIGTTEGGILSVSAHEIVVQALPTKIPEKIEVDVTPLKIGASIHISELKAPEGCTFKYAADYVVAFVAIPEKEEVVAVGGGRSRRRGRRGGSWRGPRGWRSGGRCGSGGRRCACRARLRRPRARLRRPRPRTAKKK